jgi:hypothetical protein
MATPAFLVRLMQHAGLSVQASRRLGPEDAEACQFAADLRKATLEGRLRAVWFHPANELVGTCGKVHAAIARALGLHCGVSDYFFLRGDRALVIEFKSAKGALSKDQEAFERWCFQHEIPFIVCRSRDEAMETLGNFGFMINVVR